VSDLASASLLVLGMVSAPCACFLVSPPLLLLPGLAVLSGVLRWGAGWTARLLAVMAAPALICVWAHLTGRDEAALRAARWAASAACGFYFARDAGPARIAWWLDMVGRRTGAAGGLFRDLALITSSAPAAARAAAAGMRKRSALEAVRAMEQAVTDHRQGGPLPPPGPPAPASIAGSLLAWLFAMAGLAGL
jgi:hypothetical protein